MHRVVALGAALEAVAVAGQALAAVAAALLWRPDGTGAEVAARIANWQPADELAMRSAGQKLAADLVERPRSSSSASRRTTV